MLHGRILALATFDMPRAFWTYDAHFLTLKTFDVNIKLF